MFLKSLYNHVLIDPALKFGCDELFIVSGYASATFLNRHITDLKNLRINLIIGMPSSRIDQIAYKHLIARYPDQLNVHYLKGSPPVHAKVYAWFKGQKPIVGYAGSANYSQPGFFYENQINQISNEDPTIIKSFYEDLIVRTESVIDVDETEIIESESLESNLMDSLLPGDILWEIPEKRVRISFLSRDGSLPARSGLNWGQRPEEGREPNQAYLPVRKSAKKEGFLPSTAYTFTLVTDDGESLDCAVAQQGRKAIHSTFNNSEIGKYIRKRINVPEGEFVTIDHLRAYGRTDYSLQKINDETFLFDFSV